jgi:hypothetical protein
MAEQPPIVININRVTAQDPERWLADMELLAKRRMRKTCWTIQLHEHITADLTRVWFWEGRRWGEQRERAIQFSDLTSAQSVIVDGVPALMLRYVEDEVVS